MGKAITAGRCRDFGFLPLEPSQKGEISSQKGEMPFILTIVVVASIVIIVRNFHLGFVNFKLSNTDVDRQSHVASRLKLGLPCPSGDQYVVNKHL